MSRHQARNSFFFDANGCLAERMTLGGQDVIVHHDDVPESDITEVNGVGCTTALRTLIDLAAQVSTEELELMIRDCLDRRLFTVDEALALIAQPGVSDRPGTRLFGRTLLG